MKIQKELKATEEVNMWENRNEYSLYPFIDGLPLGLASDTRSVEHVRTGPGQLPEQVPPDPRLGRPLQQGQRAHQQRVRHEALSVLQGT